MSETTCPICGQYIDVTEIKEDGIEEFVEWFDMLLTEKQVADIRADAIDEFISECVKNGIIGIGTMHDMVLIAEQLKEQNNE